MLAVTLRRQQSLGVAYALFRTLTVGQTFLVAAKLACLDLAQFRNPMQPIALLIASLLLCWASSVIPYVRPRRRAECGGRRPLKKRFGL